MIEVFGFYKFMLVNQLNKQKVLLNDFLVKKNIRGTIIISKEGINGSISGKSKDIKSLINQIKKFFLFKSFDSTSKSKCSFQPFHKPKVKIKNEIVTMKMVLSKKIRKKDSHVETQKWNKKIKNKETLVVDVRKKMEYKDRRDKKEINNNIRTIREIRKYQKK